MSPSLKAAAACALALTLAACRGSDTTKPASTLSSAAGLYVGQLADGRFVHLVLTSDHVAWGAASNLDTGQTIAFRTAYTFDGDQIQVQADQPMGIPTLTAGSKVRITGAFTATQIQAKVEITNGAGTESLPVTMDRSTQAILSVAGAGTTSPLIASIPSAVEGVASNTLLMFQLNPETGVISEGSASPVAAGAPSALHGNIAARIDAPVYQFTFQVGDPSGEGTSILENTYFQSVLIPIGARGYLGFGFGPEDGSVAEANQAQKFVFLREANIAELSRR